MTDQEQLDLLHEWQALVIKQVRLIDEYGNDRSGILVNQHDPSALKYQQLQARKWDIKKALFGKHFIGA